MPSVKRLLRAAPILGVATLTSVAATVSAQPIDRFESEVRPFLAEYCDSCHNDDLLVADLTFEEFATGADPGGHPDLWKRVAERIRAGEMPPRGRPAPERARIDAVAAVLDTIAGPADDTADGPGRVTARRLNRGEYDNTARSLLGVHGSPSVDFPADDSGYGFDNNGDVLSVSPLLMERYIAAARRLSQEAVFGPPAPEAPIQLAHYMGRRSHDADGSLDAADTLPFSLRGALYGSHLFPWTADYEFRFRIANYRRRPPRPDDAPPARPLPTDTDAGRERFIEEMRQAAPPVPVVATLDGEIFNTTIVEGVNAFGYERGEIVTRLRVEAGEHDFRVSYPHVADIADPRDNLLPDGRRILYIDYLDIVGPFDPSPEPPTSHDRIFVCRPDSTEYDESCASEIVSTLARRAYRRPVTADEVDRLTSLVAQAVAEGDSFEEGVRLAVQAVLLSPHFLFRIERDPVGSNDTHLISDHELATRLSYFLWADMPDDELSALADAGRLHEPDILREQTERLLGHPKASALVETFAAQWLQLRNLERAKPDPAEFPTVDDELRDAMRRETELFVQAVIEEDRSVLDLLDAPFTFLNGPLARHYGIEGIDGEAFQRVDLDGDQRGGLVTQGSILTVSSYPTRTSPVLRGKWVLENLLGAPPPDPPDGVPDLDEAAVGTTGSLRSQLEQHRANPTCAVCHDQIDPLGFGLERYDATGAWRTHDGEFEIDDSGTLPDGTSFRGSRELKGILRGQGEAFTRNLAEKLLTYGLGRGLESADDPTVDAITRETIESGYRFSTLVHGVVTSEPFRLRRREVPTP